MMLEVAHVTSCDSALRSEPGIRQRRKALQLNAYHMPCTQKTQSSHSQAGCNLQSLSQITALSVGILLLHCRLWLRVPTRWCPCYVARLQPQGCQQPQITRRVSEQSEFTQDLEYTCAFTCCEQGFTCQRPLQPCLCANSVALLAITVFVIVCIQTLCKHAHTLTHHSFTDMHMTCNVTLLYGSRHHTKPAWEFVQACLKGRTYELATWQNMCLLSPRKRA